MFVVNLSWFFGSALSATLSGHPVGLHLESGTDISVDVAQLPLAQVQHIRCDGTVVDDYLDQVVDLTGDPTIQLPLGSLCGVTLFLSDDLQIDGTGAGGTFHLGLDVGLVAITYASPIVVTSATCPVTTIDLGAPGWLTASSLGLSSGQHVTIGSADPEHPSLRDAVRLGSSIR